MITAKEAFELYQNARMIKEETDKVLFTIGEGIKNSALGGLVAYHYRNDNFGSENRSSNHDRILKCVLSELTKQGYGVNTKGLDNEINPCLVITWDF